MKEDLSACCVHADLSHDEAGCTIGGCPCNPTTTNEAGCPTNPNRYDCGELGCSWRIVGSSPITPQEIAEHDRKAHPSLPRFLSASYTSAEEMTDHVCDPEYREGM